MQTRTVIYKISPRAPAAGITFAMAALGHFTRAQAIAALNAQPWLLGTLPAERYWRAYLAKGYVQEVSRHE